MTEEHRDTDVQEDIGAGAWFRRPALFAMAFSRSGNKDRDVS
ncbi:hypothetical protein [Actinoplanes sp. NPDC051494]